MACDEDVKKEPLESYFIYLAVGKNCFCEENLFSRKLFRWRSIIYRRACFFFFRLSCLF